MRRRAARRSTVVWALVRVGVRSLRACGTLVHIGVLAGLSAIVGSRLAVASPSSDDPPAVEYAAAPGCVDPATFRARLAALPRAQTAGLPRGRVAIKIARTGDERYAGTLRIVGAEGEPFERHIEAATCDEVVDALELVTALAIGLQPSMAPSSATPAPPTAPAQPTPLAPAAPEVADRAPPVSDAPTPTRWQVGAGAHAVALTLLGPQLQPGIEGYLAVSAGGSSVWAPELRLSVLRVQSGTFETALGSAVLTLLTASAEGCPLRLPLWPHATVQPCAGVQVGSLQGAGSGELLAPPRTQSLGWSAMVGSARIAWTFLPYLVLEGQAGVVAPVGSHHFYFGPATTIYDVPAVGALAGAGLGAHFP
jgi:hypothetical protein